MGQSVNAVGAGDRGAVIQRARTLLRVDRSGRPGVSEPRLVLPAIEALVQLGEADVLEELLVHGFLRGSAERFEEHVAQSLVSLDGGRLPMGTPTDEAGHFCGESPRHEVELAPYAIGATPVTVELFSLFDPSRGDVPATDRRKPITDVTWAHAVLFALWVGCRLPTEAEWEFACSGGGPSQWCCDDERDLHRYAWYSENAGGAIQPVGTREPNRFGLFDLHGNVWEWCADAYEEDWYGRSPTGDPINHRWPETEVRAPGLKVCRGGSVHALAEMCRSRYRQHEPLDYWAADIGIRLATSRDGGARVTAS